MEINLYFRKVNLAMSSTSGYLWIENKQVDQLRDEHNNLARSNYNLGGVNGCIKEGTDVGDVSDMQLSSFS